MLHHNGNILHLPDGRLFTVLYGKFDGGERLNNFAVASDDGGFSWHYLSTVADASAAPGAPEGPNESAVQLLDNGDLLCIYRVSGSWDFHKSYSRDGGQTWSQAERMEGIWSVQPRLARLRNGTLVLTGGRPGLFCYLCSDGKGEVWERVNLGAHHNTLIDDQDQRFSAAFCRAENGEDPAMSTSYTSVMPLGAAAMIVTYDRLANGWSEAPAPMARSAASSAWFCRCLFKSASRLDQRSWKAFYNSRASCHSPQAAAPARCPPRSRPEESKCEPESATQNSISTLTAWA